MAHFKFALFVFLNYFGLFGTGLELRNGGYEDLVVSISDTVPATNCKEILRNLEETLTSASKYMFSALHGKAFIRSASIILPSLWPLDSCAPKNVLPVNGDISDVTVHPNDPSRGFLWTQQSAGCEQSGDQIYMSYGALETKNPVLGHSLVKEFAKYRYGVFEEQGYYNDPVYPVCFEDGDNVKITGCSDFQINDNGICDGSNKEYNTTLMVDPRARTSIMFAAEVPSVSMFCDAGNHDPNAPTKHNLLCKRRNTFDVILAHPDFHTESKTESDIMDTSPKITYKKSKMTRFIFIVENTNDMATRESWNFLRSAVRKFTMVDLPGNAELGFILTNDTDAIVVSPLTTLHNQVDRLAIPSAMPYNPGETSQSPCLHCAIRKALEMFAAKTKIAGAATHVLIMIAPGMNNNTQLMDVLNEVKKQKVRIATINYPMVLKQHPLDSLAKETNGASYSVIERKFNVQYSMLSTYFQLTNTLYNIIEMFYTGNKNDLPIEIHRREIRDGRASITGSFVLDKNMGQPSRFMLYIPNSYQPLIKNIKLISPSQHIFSQRLDMLEIKIIQIESNITEPGTWTYTIEPLQGNPQSHFLQVMATAKSRTADVIRARFWTRRNQPGGPLILLTEVKKGDFPIMAAKVEVRVSKLEPNGSILYHDCMELFDTGSGDPDITKGDGIYSRYFSASNTGAGVYTFEVTVSDNGNTAFTWKSSSDSFEDTPCCGSVILNKSHGSETVSFERVPQPITMEITASDIIAASKIPAGRILDLRRSIATPKTIRLSWTSPDMGGQKVKRYEVKYASNIADITEHFETNAKMWEWGKPLALEIGSETTFTVDMSDFLGVPLYFAVKAVAEGSGMSTISNYVRLYAPLPPPPSTVTPVFRHNFPSGSSGINEVFASDEVIPSKNDSSNIGVELILPILAGCLLLVVLLVLYFCFCVRKRNRENHKESNKAKNLENDKMNSLTIVPNTPVNNPQPSQQCYTNQLSENDHTIGVPIANMGYDDEPKKRYSLVHQQEQQLIDELKQQQMAHQQRNDQMNQSNNYGVLSVISNGTIQRGQPTLSPCNSWSASQLLHEHEKRRSPTDIAEEALLIQYQETMNQLEHMSLNGQNVDHVSLSSHQIPEHYNTVHIPPPVPPLPMYSQSPYPSNGIYGVHQPQSYPNQVIYQSMPRNDAPFTPSLQGSLNSVNSGEKKRRNVTMV
ncbi:hypothetical protein Trydic_g3189 [Trypoxylus dichotomus]